MRRRRHLDGGARGYPGHRHDPQRLLYWAGSGQAVDNVITLDGASLTADRTFTANFDLGGTIYYDFGGFKDVTAQ